MKSFCVSFCIYLFLEQSLCQPADGSSSDTLGFVKGLSSDVERNKDGLPSASSQREPKAIDSGSPTQKLDETKHPVEFKPISIKPLQQLNSQQPGQLRETHVNGEITSFLLSLPSSPLSTNSVIAGESCITANNEEGSCIPTRNCNITSLLYGSKSDFTSINILRRAYCGRDSNRKLKICCPLVESQSARPLASTTTAPAQSPVRKRITTYKEYFVPALPEPPVCGMSNTPVLKVAGGFNAALGKYPWMAILGYQNYAGAPISWNCGGSLITSRHVLTACHCVWRHEDELKIVRLGELDISRDDDGATPIDVPIKHKLKHERYSSGTNDVAILVLYDEIKFTALIRPICLPITSPPELRSNNFEDTELYVAGWGKTEWNGEKAKHLQFVRLPVIPNETCKKYWKHIDESVICAGHDEGGKDACEADSGGPLMQTIFSQEGWRMYYYGIGVVSYGKECAQPGIPGVYMRVTHFLPWILSKVVGNTSSLI